MIFSGILAKIWNFGRKFSWENAAEIGNFLILMGSFEPDPDPELDPELYVKKPRFMP